jgi:hypothetical protein
MGASGRFGSLILIGILAMAAIGCADQPLVPPSSRGAASPSPAPSSATPSFVRPTPAPSPTFLVHEVRAGETLTSIARLYGTTARSIAYWNRATYPSLDPDSADYEPDRIVVGWLLRVIPTEVVDEDELPEPTDSPSSSASGSPGPTPAVSAPGASGPPGPA